MSLMTYVISDILKFCVCQAKPHGVMTSGKAGSHGRSRPAGWRRFSWIRRVRYAAGKGWGRLMQCQFKVGQRAWFAETGDVRWKDRLDSRRSNHYPAQEAVAASFQAIGRHDTPLAMLNRSSRMGRQGDGPRATLATPKTCASLLEIPLRSFNHYRTVLIHPMEAREAFI